MTDYKIKQYSYDQAEKLGVTIKPSHLPSKKIDVYKNNKLIASIGDSMYKDFPTFLIEKGEKYANLRRKAYKKRHAKDLKKIDSNGFYANLLLW